MSAYLDRPTRALSEVETERARGEVRRMLDASNAADQNHLLINALAYLDSVEGALDKQIYPQQQSHDFDAPDDAEYDVVLTAKEWRAFGAAVTLLHTLGRSSP